MAASVETITLRRPDDWHVHLRDGEMLGTVLPFTAHQFARAIVMPIPAFRRQAGDLSGSDLKAVVQVHQRDGSW